MKLIYSLLAWLSGENFFISVMNFSISDSDGSSPPPKNKTYKILAV